MEHTCSVNPFYIKMQYLYYRPELELSCWHDWQLLILLLLPLAFLAQKTHSGKNAFLTQWRWKRMHNLNKSKSWSITISFKSWSCSEDKMFFSAITPVRTASWQLSFHVRFGLLYGWWKNYKKYIFSVLWDQRHRLNKEQSFMLWTLNSRQIK